MAGVARASAARRALAPWLRAGLAWPARAPLAARWRQHFSGGDPQARKKGWSTQGQPQSPLEAATEHAQRAKRRVRWSGALSPPLCAQARAPADAAATVRHTARRGEASRRAGPWGGVGCKQRHSRRRHCGQGRSGQVWRHWLGNARSAPARAGSACWRTSDGVCEVGGCARAFAPASLRTPRCVCARPWPRAGWLTLVRQAWWDMEGMQKPLHSFNALRIPFLYVPVSHPPSPSPSLSLPAAASHSASLRLQRVAMRITAHVGGNSACSCSHSGAAPRRSVESAHRSNRDP
jgi:hypothetical protein